MSRVVARFADGALLKGVTFDFFPGKDLFHVMPQHHAEQVAVEMRDLKALFFVKEYDGDPGHKERDLFDPQQTATGLKVSVTFSDGEVLIGTTTAYKPDGGAFFVKPADAQSNNERCYVSSTAVREVRFM